MKRVAQSGDTLYFFIDEQQYGVVPFRIGSAGPGFRFWLTGKLGRAWVVHDSGAWFGARCWLGRRGRGLFCVGFTLSYDVIIGWLLHEIREGQ